MTLISFSCKAQIGIYNTSLTDTTLDILYNYVNIIKVHGINNYNNIKCTSNSSIHKLEYDLNSYIINVYPKVKNDTIRILLNDSIIYQRSFICLKKPDLKVILGETEDTLLTKNEIKNNPQLNVILPDCYYKDNHHVVQYNVDFYLFSSKLKKGVNKIGKFYRVEYKKFDDSSYVANVLQLKDSVYHMTKKGDIIPKIRKKKTYVAFGNCLSQAHLTIIENMEKGDKIYFYNIIVRTANGADLLLPPLTIYID